MKHSLLFILLLLSCTQPQKKQEASPATDTVKTAHLQNSSTTAAAVLKDSFVANNNRYRIYTFTSHDSTAVDSLFLYQWANNQWQPALTIEEANNCEWRTDVNLDGYTDLIIQYKYAHQAHLYQPSTRTFDKQYIIISTDIGVLDSTQKIFCNNWWTRSAAFSSDLYTFVADTPYVFYKYEVIAKAYPNQFDVKKIVLYQCKNGNRDSALFIRNLQPGEINRDDFRFFWQKNWHKLLQR